jgi:hypothetical protein
VAVRSEKLTNQGDLPAVIRIVLNDAQDRRPIGYTDTEQAIAFRPDLFDKSFLGQFPQCHK